ncbi:MAG: hypothetical protein Fues2KO_01190 [Fuerstiella sp.]
MQDASNSSRKQNKVSTIVSGIVIAVVAGAIGMQLARVTSDVAAAEDVAPTATQSADQPESVGRVNGELISYDELARECVERHGKEVLDNIINRKLVQQACSKAGVSVSAAEVNTEIVRISKKFGLATDQWEKMLLTERGLTPIQYRRDVIWPMLALKKLAGKSVKVTREDLEHAYEDAYGPKVKAKMIVLDNFRRATKVRELLQKNPDEFEELAREYSVEPNSRALGGTIPPIRRHSGAADELRRAAFKMKTPGEISGIVQTDVGQWVILRFEGMTEHIEHDPAEVEALLTEEIREQEVQRLVATTFEQLKKTSRIDNFVTGETHQPIQQASARGTTGEVTPVSSTN